MRQQNQHGDKPVPPKESICGSITCGSFVLDQKYVTKSQKITDQQLAKAGIRLAEILNEALE